MAGSGGGVSVLPNPAEELELGSIPVLETPGTGQSPRVLGYGGYGGYGGDMVLVAGGTHVAVESLAQAAVILVIGVAIIISNIIILATFITMPGTLRQSPLSSSLFLPLCYYFYASFPVYLTCDTSILTSPNSQTISDFRNLI